MRVQANLWYLCQISRANHAIIYLYYNLRKSVIVIVIFTCRYSKLSWNTYALGQSSNFIFRVWARVFSDDRELWNMYAYSWIRLRDDNTFHTGSPELWWSIEITILHCGIHVLLYSRRTLLYTIFQFAYQSFSSVSGLLVRRIKNWSMFQKEQLLQVA